MRDHQRAWLDDYRSNASAYRLLLGQTSPRQWASTPDLPLFYALKVAAAEGPSSTVDTFLRRSIDVSLRALTAQPSRRRRQHKQDFSYPPLRARLLRVHTWATLLLTGSFDPSPLVEASALLSRHVAGAKGAGWGPLEQSWFISSARLLTVARDRSSAWAVLATRKSCRLHTTEFCLLRNLLSSTSPPPPVHDSLAHSGWQSLFDTIRHPRFREATYVDIDLARVEIAALIDAWFTSDRGVPNGYRVVNSLAKGAS